MDEKMLSVLSIILGYTNLIENREQSAHNDVSSANDKQAQYILSEINRKFDEQKEILDKIMTILEAPENERN